MKKQQRYIYIVAVLCSLFWPQKEAMALQINEIVACGSSQNYFELYGAAGESLNNYTYLVIDGHNNPGKITDAFSLAGYTIPDDHYFLGMGNGDYDYYPNEDFSADFYFPTRSQTHMLVEGFTGSQYQDLDADDDGVLDTTPWTAIIDSAASQYGSEPIYSTTTIELGVWSSPSYRISDGAIWESVDDHETPGSPNYPSPQAPYDPSSTNITTSQIRWEWTQSSFNETGFLVYAGAGATAPSTAITTAGVNVTVWDHTDLTTNTQYSFQVAATNAYGDSTKTDTISCYTLADTPGAPTIDNITSTTLDVSLDVNGNPANTEFAIYNQTLGQWVQGDGSLGASVVWQTASVWGAATVTELQSSVNYAFYTLARNGDGVETANSASVDATTVDAIAPTFDPAAAPSYANSSPIVVSYVNAQDPLEGSGLKHLELWFKKGTEGSWTDSGLRQTTQNGSFNFESITGDDAYYFALVAEDNDGNRSAEASGSGDDNTIYDTQQPDTPFAPVDSGAAANNTSLTFSWTAPSDPGGSGVASFDYEISTESGFISVVDSGNLTTTTVSFTGEWDTTYYCRVRAIDNAGNTGSYSSASDGIELINIFYVDADVSSSGDGTTWTQALKTISEALTSATLGSEIRIAEGEYIELITMKSGVMVYGGYSGYGLTRDIDAYPTIIDGDGGDHVVTMDSVTTCILDGVTVTGGEVTYSEHPGDYKELSGAGIRCLNMDDSSTISYCTITGNESYWIGGGVYLSLASPTITHCMIRNNICSTAGGGGGLFVGGSSSLITDCYILGNNCYNYATGVDLSGGFPTIRNSYICGNYGGGYYAQAITVQSGCSATIENSVISANLGNESSDGTIWLYDDASLTLSNCLFAGNYTRYGVGVYNTNIAALNINNCTFAFNESSYPNSYGLINIYQSPLNPLENPIYITNTIFSHNDSRVIFEETNGSDIIPVHNLFYGDRSYFYDRQTGMHSSVDSINTNITGAFGNIEGDPEFPVLTTGTWTSDPVYDSTENITVLTDTSANFTDDEFAGMLLMPNTDRMRMAYIVSNTSTTISVVAKQAEDIRNDPNNFYISSGDEYAFIDFHPPQTSPAVDAGYNAAPNMPDLDFEGSPRIEDGTVDLGIYETADFKDPYIDSITLLDADPTSAVSVSFQVWFSEDVTGVDLGDFSLSVIGLTSSSLTGLSGSGQDYTVTVNTGSGEGTIGIELNDDDSIEDVTSKKLGGTGSGNGDYTSGDYYTIDRTQPGVTLSSASSNPTSSSVIAITASFDEDVTGFSVSDIEVGNGSASNFIAVDPQTYTFNITISVDGPVTVDVAAGVCSDLAGNLNLIATQLNRTYDGSAAYVDDAVAPALTNASPITVAYSGAGDSCVGLKHVELWFKKGGAGVWTDSGLRETAASDAFSFTGMTGDDTYYFDLVAEDLVGNRSAAADGSGDDSTLYDTQAPDAPSTPTDAGLYWTETTSMTFSWIAPNDPGDSGIAEYDYEIATDAGFISVVTSDSLTTTSVDFIGVEGSTYYCHVRARDNVGNTGSYSPASDGVTVDMTPPSAPAVSGDASPTSDTQPSWSWTSGGGGNGTYRCKLDEADLTSGSLLTTATLFTPGASLSDGSHTLYVQERDDAGNWSASGSHALTVDTLAPLITISAPDISLLASLQEISYQLDIAGADQVNLTIDQVMLHVTGATTAIIQVINIDATSAEVKLLNVNGQGTISISIEEGVASDAAGNLSAAIDRIDPVDVSSPLEEEASSIHIDWKLYH